MSTDTTQQEQLGPMSSTRGDYIVKFDRFYKIPKNSIFIPYILYIQVLPPGP